MHEAIEVIVVVVDHHLSLQNKTQIKQKEEKKTTITIYFLPEPSEWSNSFAIDNNSFTIIGLSNEKRKFYKEKETR